MADSNMIVALDIGTSKVVCLVAEIMADGEMQIVGVGSHQSRGMKRGVVVNIDSTVNAISRAVEDAELMAGCKIHSLSVGASGSHICSVNSSGIVAVRDREVAEGDLDRVVDAARAVALPADQSVMHVLPQEFVIDCQEGIRDPLGMSGVRLEAKVHLVTGASNALFNVEKCVRRCELDVDQLVVSQLASSQAVLTEDERELGVCLVDIGSGTSDIAVYSGGSLIHTSVIPVAGDQVTNDIAVALRTSSQNAEELKVKYACAIADPSAAHEQVQVAGIGDRPERACTRKQLADVVGPRYEELFTLIRENLDQHECLSQIPVGVVLTGGTARMEGAVELAEDVFGMPVRLAAPKDLGSMTDLLGNPQYSTAVGLLEYAAQNEQQGVGVSLAEPEGVMLGEPQPGLMNRVKTWIQANF